MQIEQHHETQRLLNLAARIEGETLAVWLGVHRRVPFDWCDARYEAARAELERQERVRERRAG